MQCGYQGQEMKPVVSWGTEVGPVSLFVRLSYQRYSLTMGFGPKDHHRQLVSWSQFLLRNTVSQANDKLIHCSTVSLCQLERCSIQRDRLVGRLYYSTKELLKRPNTTQGDIRRLQGRCRLLPDPPPVFETADDKSGSNGRGSLPLPAITNHYHHRPHPFTEGKLTQKLNFPSVSGSFFVSCTISVSKTIWWSHF